MGWSIGFDKNHDRDIGYGVPCMCDAPGCDNEIDRGLSYVCGGDLYGGDHGCGLFFCGNHLNNIMMNNGDFTQLCKRCELDKEPFIPKADLKKWIDHKLTHHSWENWRIENPKKVNELKKQRAKNE